jgi:hypothetical protein
MGLSVGYLAEWSLLVFAGGRVLDACVCPECSAQQGKGLWVP